MSIPTVAARVLAVCRHGVSYTSPSWLGPVWLRYVVCDACPHVLQYARSSTIFMSLFRLDYELHDIPQDEEDNHNLHPLPRQDIRFDSLTDQQCYANTSFTKAQLC